MLTVLNCRFTGIALLETQLIMAHLLYMLFQQNSFIAGSVWLKIYNTMNKISHFSTIYEVSGWLSGKLSQLDHEDACLNHARDGIHLLTTQRFIAQSLSL